MKKTIVQSVVLVFGILLAANLTVAAPPGGNLAKYVDATATVRSIKGSADCVLPCGEKKPLKLFMQLPPGTLIETASGAEVTITDDRLDSKILEKSVVLLTSMKRGLGKYAKDSETAIEIKQGAISGGVVKQREGSSYTVDAGACHASIRGNRFLVTVKPDVKGRMKPTFYAIEGKVLVTANLTDISFVTLVAGTQCTLTSGILETQTIDQFTMVEYKMPIIIRDVAPTLSSAEVEAQPVKIIQPFNGNGPPQPAYRNPIPGPGNNPSSVLPIPTRH